MTLVDTSIWIEVFRARRPLDIEAVVSLDDVVTCLPVVQEVLQGFREEAAFRLARTSLFALPMADATITAQRIEEAVDLHRKARRAGLTVRSSVDCLIAAMALAHDLEVLHRDRDFGALAKVSPLRARSA